MESEIISIDVEMSDSEVTEGLELVIKDLEKVKQSVMGIALLAVKSFTLITQSLKSLSLGFASMAGSMVSVLQRLSEIATLQGQQPKTQWTEDLSAIGNVCTILQTLIALTNEHIMAKLISKAEDIAIITLYAVDYIAAFGAVIAQLGISTAAWISNTAAKAASTAAEWAHIAATTAWNAICTAATAVTTAFSAAISFLTSPIGLVLIAVTALIAIVVLLVKNWDTVKEVAAKVWQGIVDTWNTVSAWFDENVIQPVVQFFTDMWSGICKFATDAWDGIVEVFVGVATWFDQNVVQPVAGFFSDLWSGICGFASDAWDGIVEVFTGVATWFDENVVQPVVEIVDGIAEGFKNMVNGVIGFINGMISGIISGINGVIRALNKIQFTVPDWVPGLGGETLGFNLKTLTAPQIPYLAKGAVLPANKPFMAVVGDQRHGTNIEAPLATIQEAVGLVMEEHISAMMAGFQALLEEQRAIRRTVEGIEIGDDVIGEAALRYNRKMAVVYGV